MGIKLTPDRESENAPSVERIRAQARRSQESRAETQREAGEQRAVNEDIVQISARARERVALGDAAAQARGQALSNQVPRGVPGRGSVPRPVSQAPGPPPGAPRAPLPGRANPPVENDLAEPLPSAGEMRRRAEGVQERPAERPEPPADVNEERAEEPQEERNPRT